MRVGAGIGRRLGPVVGSFRTPGSPGSNHFASGSGLGSSQRSRNAACHRGSGWRCEKRKYENEVRCWNLERLKIHESIDLFVPLVAVVNGGYQGI